jgi:hypothetical protein
VVEDPEGFSGYSPTEANLSSTGVSLPDDPSGAWVDAWPREPSV